MGSARALGDDNPPQANAIVKRVASGQSVVGRRASFPRRTGRRRQQVRRGAEVDRAGAGHERFEPRRASAARGAGIRPGQAGRIRSRGRQGAGHFAAIRGRVPPGRRAGRAQLSLRRSGDADAPGAHARSARTRARRPISGMHLLRTGDEPGARNALEASFKSDPYDVVTLNLLRMLDTLDAFVTVRDGDLIMRMSKDEAPVLQDYAIPLAHQALSTLSARYQFTPKGPILIEIFPKHDDFAVRNLGLPGHDRRPRRLLRPRGHDGFAAGAAARRIPVGSDALARARARHHDPDVQPANPALADRRHFRLRGKARPARVGPRDGRRIREHAEPRRDAEAARI